MIESYIVTNLNEQKLLKIWTVFRKITPHIDPIDPGSHMSMHFLEEQTNLYTAQPQPQLMPQPLPKVLKISNIGTQDFQVQTL